MSEKEITYTIEKFHYKGYSIWKQKGNAASPMLILTKPKHLSEEDYEAFVKSLIITVKEKRDEKRKTNHKALQRA